jgi:hypothetical protein
MRMRMTTTQKTTLHPLHMRHLLLPPEEIIVNEEDLVEMAQVLEHNVVLAEAEPEVRPSRLMDALDDLDDPIEADYDVDE